MKINVNLLSPVLRAVNSPKFIKVLAGGRGCGKSYNTSQVIIAKALSKKCNVLCCRETLNSLADSSLGVLKTVIKDMELDDYFYTTRNTLECVNGSSFIFRGLQQSHRIKSIEDVDLAWVDEADAVKAQSWDDLLPTIRKEGAEVWVNYNPQYDDDYVHAMFYLQNHPLVHKEMMTYNDNPYISKSLLAQIEYCRNHDYEKYQHLYLGKTIKNSSAQIFKNSYKVLSFASFSAFFNTKTDVLTLKTGKNDVNERENDVISSTTSADIGFYGLKQSEPSNGIYYIGIDFGFRDPTVLTRSWITDDNQLVIDYEFYEVELDIAQLPHLIKQIPGYEHAIIVADNSRPETITYINNRLRYNQVIPCRKGKNSIQDGIEQLKAFNQIYILDNCVNTIDEFKLYSYVVDSRSGLVTNIPEDKHNHCIDSVRYAINKAETGATGKLEFSTAYDNLIL